LNRDKGREAWRLHSATAYCGRGLEKEILLRRKEIHLGEMEMKSGHALAFCLQWSIVGTEKLWGKKREKIFTGESGQVKGGVRLQQARMRTPDGKSRQTQKGKYQAEFKIPFKPVSGVDTLIGPFKRPL